jgi:thiamine pyrophosphate-dependent acetolactate synthase large subunit-like protein
MTALCPAIQGQIKTETSTAQRGIVVRVARDHAPVLALSGDMPRKMHGTDFIQTTEPDLLFQDVSLYTETVASRAQAPTRRQ